jgi:hypothetical protein
MRQRVAGGEIADREYAASEPRPRAGAIDPRHRIAVVSIGALERFERVVDIGRADQLAFQICGFDAPQAHLDIEDHAGQPHPADGRPEQIGVVLARAAPDLARCEHQIEARHVG